MLEVEKAVYKNHMVYKTTSTTRSNQFISLIYPVHDVIESYMDIKSLYPYRYRARQSEGSFRSDKEIIFNRESNSASYVNHRSAGKQKTSEISQGTHDPLSVVYYFRTLPIEIGKDIYIDVFDGKKNWSILVQVLKKEQVWTPAGTFNTIKVKPQMKFEGLFVNKGDVYIWFTDDVFRIPVKMESKIKIGNITAMLLEKRLPGP